MANSYSTDLILDTIGKTTRTYLGDKLAGWQSFTTDFSNEGIVLQGQNVRVPVQTVGATAQTNPTNWETGNSNVGNVNVLVNHYSQSWHITPLERNHGMTLDQIVALNVRNFSYKLWDVVTAPMTTTNFSNVTVAAASLVAANLKTVWAACAKATSKNILLDATSYSQLLPSDLYGYQMKGEPGQVRGAYGFDGFWLNTRWDGAGTNVFGFAGGPEAIGIYADVPIFDDEVRQDINATEISIPIGPATLTVLSSTWVNRATRLRWASLDVALGAAKFDNTAARVIISA